MLANVTWYNVGNAEDDGFVIPEEAFLCEESKPIHIL